MGRHSSPNQVPFYRSFLGWMSLWGIIALVTGVAVWLFVGAIAGDEGRRTVVAQKDADEPTRPEPEVSGLRVDRPDPEPTETAAARATLEPDDTDSKLVTEGVTVQVLNGTFKPAAARALADKLGGLGYSIVAVEESSRVYSETTVFWSTGASRDAAMALAERFGWLAEPKPDNLSDEVSVHVVVGADET